MSGGRRDHTATNGEEEGGVGARHLQRAEELLRRLELDLPDAVWQRMLHEAFGVGETPIEDGTI